MAHRKVDVDIEDEDQFVDDEIAGLSYQEQEAFLNSKVSEVRSLISR